MKTKKAKDPLTRSIEQRKRGIQAAKNRIAEIRLAAEERCAKIEKSIAKNRILLEAIERGVLKP